MPDLRLGAGRRDHPGGVLELPGHLDEALDPVGDEEVMEDVVWELAEALEHVTGGTHGQRYEDAQRILEYLERRGYRVRHL